MPYYAGTDIGGTFTDCVVMDDEGRLTVTKTPSSPENFAEGLIDAISEAASCAELGLETLLSDTRLFSHGCTVATNTLINRNGARVGIITTRGFEETLLIMRGSAYCQGLPPKAWYMKSQNERPFEVVPLDRIIGVTERIDSRGNVAVRLNEEEVHRAARTLVEGKGCEAISIAFLWSFANPEHERAAADIVRALYPDMYVDTSHEVVPMLGEYERFSTTALNSYLRPGVESYVVDLAERLRKHKLAASPLLMQANAGLLPFLEAAKEAVRVLHSGPTGGLIACRIIGSLIGSENIITSDMGGTSFDISIIWRGTIDYTVRAYHERHVVATPMADIESIGAGGGSIAYIHDGIMKVGPQSAGMSPGPVCYGRGGAEPTVTDANVVLGYLNPDNFLGGRMPLDKEAAENAICNRLAEPLGLSTVEAACGILRIVNSHMSDAIRFHAVQRGYDPRDFDLFIFGGAGPAHAIAIGEELEAKSIIIPLSGLATVLSAFGIVNSDVLRFYQASFSMPFPPPDIGGLERIFRELEERGASDLQSDGFDPASISVARSASMRYHLQVTDVDVDLPDKELTEQTALEVVEAFDRRYADLYGENAGFKEAGRDMILQFVRAVAQTPKGKIEPRPMDGESPSAAHMGHRRAFFLEPGDFVETDIYDGESLNPGNIVTGPAILEMAGTTVVIAPGYQGRLDEYCNIVLERGRP
jgi:N-methylhydantoinase A